MGTNFIDTTSMTKILFVNDDSAFNKAYEEKLLARGFAFQSATSKQEALDAVSQQSFDVIIVDIDIEGGERGIELLQALRSTACQPDQKILIFSNSTDRPLHKRVLGFHPDGFITKSDFPPIPFVDEVLRFLYQFEEQEKNRNRIQNGGPQKKNKRILFVESDDAFIDMYGRRLKDEGYEVEFARSKPAAEEKSKASVYDAIIIDMLMPKLDGRALVVHLSNDEVTKTIPIFLFNIPLDEDILGGVNRKDIRVYDKLRLIPSEMAREINNFLE